MLELLNGRLDRDLNLAERIFARPEVLAYAVGAGLVLGVIGLLLGRLFGWRALFTGLSLGSLGGVLAVTLVRVGRQGGEAASLGQAWAECIQNEFSLAGSWQRLNFVLLMPFAFFGAIAVRRFLPVALLSVALAVGIELYQGMTGLGACETQDMINNGLGGVLAALIGWAVAGRRGGGRLRNATPPGSAGQHAALMSTVR
ncbi:VanZ family protein [Crossiella sp. CA198]|uniref:VanZ family protein n=1 Tax=Crossiella sp. CA198 TaxID=3455607 RepID=UPI003F8D309C